jgi:hypothetical protein
MKHLESAYDDHGSKSRDTIRPSLLFVSSSRVSRGGSAIIFGPGNMKQTGPRTANYTILLLQLPKKCFILHQFQNLFSFQISKI